MKSNNRIRRIGSKVLAGVMAFAIAMSPVASTAVLAAGNEQSNTGDQGVNITLNAAQTEVDPGGDIDYTIKVSTTEYTGEAKITLALDSSITAKEITSTPIQRGMIEGQETSTVTFTMTEFKPDDPDVILTVKATAPADLSADTAKDAVATIEYGTDKSVSVTVPVTVKEAYPLTGDTKAEVTMTQTMGEESVVPGSKVRYKLSAALSSEIDTVTTVNNVKLHIDIPSEFTGVNVTGYKNNEPFSGSFTNGIATADFGTVSISDVLEMEAEITIPEKYTYKEFTFKGYVSGPDVTSNNQTLKLNTTEEIRRVQDEPSVYLAWKDLDSTKDRVFRTSDVLPVSIIIVNRDTNVDMEDIQITMKVPQGFNVVEDLNAQGIVSDKTSFVWNVNKIEKNSKHTIDLGFVPTAGVISDKFAADVKMTYSNHPLEKDDAVTSNVLKATREVPKADVLDIKVLQNNTDKDIIVSAGQNITYSIVATNNGDVDLKKVTVKGTLASGLIYGKSDKTSVVQRDGIVTWTIDELAAGKSQTMTFDVTVPKSNVAASYSLLMEGNADDVAEAKSNTATMTTGRSTVTVDMYQRKSGMDNGTKDDMTVEYGDTYTYIIAVQNEGSANAKSTTITTTLPGSLKLNQSSLPKGMTYSGSTLKWTIYDLEPDVILKANIKVTAPTAVTSTNTSQSKTTTVKKMTLNVNSTYSWTDAANNSWSSDSNTVTTVVEQKTEVKPNDETKKEETKVKPVNNSGLDTAVVSVTTGTQMLAYKDMDVVRVVAAYTNLKPNTHYTGSVGMINESGGVFKQIDGRDATMYLDFTTSDKAGTVGVFDFIIEGKSYTDKCMYAAMNVVSDDGQVYGYTGIGFDQSTMRSASVIGAAVSNATVSASKTAQASVTVGYNNVHPGIGYQVSATLIDRSTGRPMVKADGKDVMGTANFIAKDTKGQVDVPFTFGSDDVDNKDLAVYVTLYDANGNTVLAIDQDMNTRQTANNSSNTSSSSTSSSSTSSSNTSSNTSSSNSSAKGDDTREIVKTGEVSPLTVILVLSGICMVSGMGYVFLKKKNLLGAISERNDK